MRGVALAARLLAGARCVASLQTPCTVGPRTAHKEHQWTRDDTEEQLAQRRQRATQQKRSAEASQSGTETIEIQRDHEEER